MSIIGLNERARHEIYRHTPPNSLPTLDVCVGGLDVNTLEIRITTSAGKVSGPHVFDIKGPFTVDNAALVDWLTDLVMETFTVVIHSNDKSLDLNSRIVLVGALSHLLCSTDACSEQAITLIDGIFCDNTYEQHNLGIHLQDLVYCLLKQTLDAALDDIRTEDFVERSYQERHITFAAVAILCQELEHFRQCLEVAAVRGTGLLPGRFKQSLISDLLSIETELNDRLQAGCARFPHWRTTIQRLVNNLRRTEETIQLSLMLTQVKFFDIQLYSPPQDVQPYTLWGNGEGCLLQAPSATMAQVAGLSYNIHEGMEQQLDHVSGSLPSGTREETSVLITCSLFPSLRRHIRYANHLEMM